jgi:hypothetical protein
LTARMSPSRFNDPVSNDSSISTSKSCFIWQHWPKTTSKNFLSINP